MAFLTRTLIEELRTKDVSTAGKPDATVLFDYLRPYSRIIVGGEAYTIENRLRDYGGVYMPTSREWIFLDPDDETLRALCELIAYKNVITVKPTHGRVSQRISMASIT